MKHHQYRITVEHLATPNVDDKLNQPLVFTASNHDDVFKIKERISGKLGLKPTAEAPFIVGLKLISEVMLTHRKIPLFIETQGLILQLIKTLKAHIRQSEIS